MRNFLLLVITTSLIISNLQVFAQHTSVYDQELIRLKSEAKEKLSRQVDLFNAYRDRPESDGPYRKENNKDFLLNNVPFFDCDDTLLSEVYNYRWWMISKHLKEYNDPYDHKKYWVVTEFFGVKPWASRSGAITCPAGHQFYDVRWLRDNQYLKSYTDYFISGSASKLNQRENANFLTYLSRPESHHFSSWMINGVDAFLKIHPDKTWLREKLPDLERHQQVWDSLFTVKNKHSPTFGMYKILDLYNGMEFSLSAVMGLIKSEGPYSIYTNESWRNYYLGWETTGRAAQSLQAKQYPKAFRSGYPDFYMVRPSVNSYVYGNLKSLADLYRQDAFNFKDEHSATKAALYQKNATNLQEKVLTVLWNDDDKFFNSLTAGDNEFGVKDFQSNVRESVGYSPWYFKLIPLKHYRKFGESWNMFSSTKGFYHTKGMTTAERQHPFYNEQAYAWNGRGWPYENSVVYKGYANYLRDYKKNASLGEKQLLIDYVMKLARMHGSKEKNIGEWYIPSNGESFGGEKDYFHSSFPDIIIEDLIGFKASHADEFAIEPLLYDDLWNYFYLGNIRYHNHDIDIVWKKDWDPDKPGNQSKICVWVDGKLRDSRKSLAEKMKIKL